MHVHFLRPKTYTFIGRRRWSHAHPDPCKRDYENGFRLVELTVPLASPVTIVAQPRLISKSGKTCPECSQPVELCRRVDGSCKEGWSCSTCACSGAPDTPRWVCKACSYDQCSACRESLNRHPTESIAPGSDLGIALCTPLGKLVGVDWGLGKQKFRFRSLQGHTIDNLIHQWERVVAEHKWTATRGWMITAVGVVLLASATIVT